MMTEKEYIRKGDIFYVELGTERNGHIQNGGSSGTRPCIVSIRIIQAYEQRMRDINKAQLATIVYLSQALDCDAIDLLEK